MKLITIINWRRPDMYQAVLTSLMNNDGIEDYTLLNYVDPFGQFPDQFRKIDETHPLNGKCQGIRTFVHKKPMGCAGNTGYSFEHAFSLFDNPRPDDYVLHLEDDVIPGRDWIRFMEWGLETYFEDKDIFIVTGHNRRNGTIEPARLQREMMLASRREPVTKESLTYQGWGYWRDRWEQCLPWFGIHWKSSEPFHVKFGEEFLSQVRKANDGSWGWVMKQYWRKRRKEIFPLVSRTQNIGSDRGRFNQNAKWHLENVHSDIWSDQLPGPPQYVEIGQ